MKVAIYGSGQLAAMMATESKDQGHEFTFIAEPGESSTCVEGLGTTVLITPDMTAKEVYLAIGEPDVITVERESVPVAILRELEAYCPVCPNPSIIEVTQNRAREKTALTEMKIPVAPFRIISKPSDLESALDTLGAPIFVKTTENGYDGKGQWKISDVEGIAEIPEQAFETGLIAEQAIHFEMEVSLVGVRGGDGDIKIYPVSKNTHLDGILYLSIAPYDGLNPGLLVAAKNCMKKVLQEYNYIGALAIEFFVTKDTILVNELAPRVHNSGHWTMQGATSSQFENHIRAITQMALLDTSAEGFSAMVNLIGVDNVKVSNRGSVTRLYGKGLRAGRKMGHVNLNEKTYSALETSARKAFVDIYGRDKSSAVFRE